MHSLPRPCSPAAPTLENVWFGGPLSLPVGLTISFLAKEPFLIVAIYYQSAARPASKVSKCFFRLLEDSSAENWWWWWWELEERGLTRAPYG